MSNRQTIYDDLCRIERNLGLNYAVFNNTKVSRDPLKSDFVISVEEFLKNTVLIGCKKEKFNVVKTLLDFIEKSEDLNWRIISLKFLDEDEDLTIVATVKEKTRSETIISKL